MVLYMKLSQKEWFRHDHGGMITGRLFTDKTRRNAFNIPSDAVVEVSLFNDTVVMLTKIAVKGTESADLNKFTYIVGKGDIIHSGGYRFGVSIVSPTKISSVRPIDFFVHNAGRQYV